MHREPPYPSTENVNDVMAVTAGTPAVDLRQFCCARYILAVQISLYDCRHSVIVETKRDRGFLHAACDAIGL
jgi:hypothetical protein